MYDSNKTEEEVMQYWKDKKIYEKARGKCSGKEKFYFLDGPPYATGNIHIGTAMNKIIKDCYIRYFRMSGFDVWDQPGYDTHGVPIEHKVEKKLGFRSKKDIEKFGTENFIRECKSFVSGFINPMNSQFMNLGAWMDWDRPYLTMDNEYIEGAWFTFKNAFEKGLLFKDVYPVHVCSRCGTVVAYNEIEYSEISDKSIYVKFPLKDMPGEYIIIWTTTPWTLPSNTGVMANPEAEYVRVSVGNEIWILASNLLKSFMERAGIEKYNVIEKFKGSELEGTGYHHPMEDMFEFQQGLANAHRIVLSEKFVTMEDGTGLVHTAPGHGQEDYQVGIENKLPIINPLGIDGRFNEKSGKLSGVFAKEADSIIIEELRKRGLLVREEVITHDYPFCWRCENPLLLMTMPQWFFRVTKIREKLIEENEKINWVPEWAKQRFKNWLESLGDWPISRQRYWGIPLPIWVCDACNEISVIGSADELPKVPDDLHKPYIDEITWTCKKCKNGTMKRVPDVLDVWFDSGVAPWASLGYPKNKELFDRMKPVDFILEGPDQIRGWWNSLMITGVMTFDRKPFENALFHGFVMDNHGIKMSKSKGNVVTPEEIIEKQGRDILRYYFLSGTPWDDYYFNWDKTNDIAKSFVIVKNTFNFITTYVKPETGKMTRPKPSEFEKEDLWIISRLNSLVKKYNENFRKFHCHRSIQDLMDFILNDFSRWYIKVIRDRVWIHYNGADKGSAFYTLMTTADTLARLMSPVMPFMSEKVYQDIKALLPFDEESVHLLPMPREDEDLIDERLEKDMEMVKNLFEACSAARQEASLKLRWPVSEIVFVAKNKDSAASARNMEKIILNMCNCKSLVISESIPEGDYAKKEFSEGIVLISRKMDDETMQDAIIREVVRKIQSMRKENRFDVIESITLFISSGGKTDRILEKNFEKISKGVGAKNISLGRGGEFKGSIDFSGNVIEIGFDRA